MCGHVGVVSCTYSIGSLAPPAQIVLTDCAVGCLPDAYHSGTGVTPRQDVGVVLVRADKDDGRGTCPCQLHRDGMGWSLSRG